MMSELHFKTNTLLKNLVGKDLINDDNIAVVELVKNSYDADSSEVLIKFERIINKNETSAPSHLIIYDCGNGMTQQDIEDKWLNIAYSEKKNISREHGEPFAGNKGIGRFSCDRLGEHLDMFTRSANGKLLHLNIDWPDFEIEGNKDLTIQEIGLKLSETNKKFVKKKTGLDMPTHGTVLSITRLRSEWNADKLHTLKRMLEKFVNPNQLFQKNKFKIQISVPELEKEEASNRYHNRINGIVRNQVFEKLKFKTTYIESEIDEFGKTIKTELSHEGISVFRLEEFNKDYPHLKNIKVVIYYLNPYKKSYFTRQTGVRSIDFGSIFLFLNGFRIAPYGGRGDDWLGLDIRKTQGVQRYVSSRDLVGRIEIVDKEDNFVPISSREGLKNTYAFSELREVYVLDIIRKLEKFIVEGLGWDSVPDRIRKELVHENGLDWRKTREEYLESWERKKQRIALSIMTFIGSTQDRIIKFWFNPALLEGLHEEKSDEIKSLINNIDKFKPGKVDPNLKKDLKKVSNILKNQEKELKISKEKQAKLRVAIENQGQKINRLKKEKETYQSQTLFLKSVSTLDTKQLLNFHHQICLDASIIDNYINKIIADLKKNEIDSVMKSIEKISLANKRITTIAQFATKANFKSATKKELTDIPSYFEQYINNIAFDYVASGVKIEVNNSIKGAFEIKARRIELSILIDNIISNAKKANATKIIINIIKLGVNRLQISFIDNGIGLSSKLTSRDEVFDIGVTTTHGSGLGLHHVKNIIDSLDGTIKLIPNQPKGTEVQITLIK